MQLIEPNTHGRFRYVECMAQRRQGYGASAIVSFDQCRRHQNVRGHAVRLALINTTKLAPIHPIVDQTIADQITVQHEMRNLMCDRETDPPRLIGRVDVDRISRGALMVSHNLAGDVSRDRKSTRLNSSHVEISYAVFCLKKKKNKKNIN